MRSSSQKKIIGSPIIHVSDKTKINYSQQQLFCSFALSLIFISGITLIATLVTITAGTSSIVLVLILVHKNIYVEKKKLKKNYKTIQINLQKNFQIIFKTIYNYIFIYIIS